jgi:hypothetical protein
MWEVMSYGERPYWDMSNQDVGATLCSKRELTHYFHYYWNISFNGSLEITFIEL